MNEFIELFLFSLFPFLVSIFIALIISPLGAALYMRNEILYGISLPPIGTSAIALLLMAGLPEKMHWLLHIFAALFIFAVTAAFSQQSKFKLASFKRREIELASFFIFGHAFTYLLMTISTNVDTHLEYLLKGELLTIHRQEFQYFMSFMVILFILAVFLRRPLFALVIDEEFFAMKNDKFRIALYAYKLLLAISVTGAIVFSGSLFTTALLILPSLFTSDYVKGLLPFIFSVMTFSLLSTVIGFFIALWMDMPPVYLIVLTMLIMGLLLKFILNGIFVIRQKSA